MRSRESFAKQANYIGLAKKCKRFILSLSEMKEETKQKVYRSAKSPKQLAECDLVYEVLTKLMTSKYTRNRKFGSGHVPAATKNLKTKLTNVKLERELVGFKTHNAYSILSSVEQMTDSIELHAREMVTEGGLDPDDKPVTKLSKEVEEQLDRAIKEKVIEMMADDGNRCSDGDAVDSVMETEMSECIDPESEKSRKDDNAVSDKLGFNRFMLSSIWTIGRQRLLSDNVKKMRTECRKRETRRRRINVAIRKAQPDVPSQANTFTQDVASPTMCWKEKMMIHYPEYYVHN